MLKFIRGKGGHTSAERIKVQKELFSFNKTGSHGFPHHPSALAFDHKLNLLGIGTRNGSLRIYGGPGVEFHSQLESEAEIRQLLFIENRAQVITICSDSSLQLWEINTKEENNVKNGVLECVKTFDYFANESSKEGSLKQITTVSINSSNDLLLIGTQSGNTYLLDLDKFDLTDQIIYQDVVLQNIPDDYKFNPGSVEVIAEQPLNPNKFLIGYNRGLLVLWDNQTLSADNYYVANQQLESVHWLYDGKQFMSAHNDGSYIVWKTSDNLHPAEQPKTPYGPFPCKAINKLIWKTVENSDDYIILSGGMPRASYNDKHTVSIIQGTLESGKHHVLDFTSKVIDFLVIDSRNNPKDSDNPTTLVVLVEEEIVLIDLTHPEWLQHKLPYLSSVHSSAITCCQHYSNVSEEVYKQIVESGKKQSAGKFTSKEWPITGGEAINETVVGRDVLVTGHEDGSVRFWNASSVAMEHLYTLMTSKLFLLSDDDIALIDSDDNALNETNTEDEWPPFRKVGTFDPYSDDPRFAVRKIVLCIYTGSLVIAGTAGQVIVFEFNSEAQEKPVNSFQLALVGDKDGFVWKGHSQLTPKNGNIKLESGYQASSIVQLQPPAAVTALSIYSEWGLLAAGTAHGFGIFDYSYRKVVSAKTTLNPNDLISTSGGDALISRRKSFKKSLRESFRRLRKGRSQRGDKRTGSPSSTAGSSSSPSKSTEEGRKSPKGEVIQLETKPVERQIEARGSSEDSMGSMVRCLYFSNAFIVNSSTQTPTLWAATNAGNVFIYTIVMPSDDKRASEDVTSQLAKEIHLKHKAPIIAINIIDGNGIPLPDSYEVIKGVSKVPTASGHRVLICSEEQFKLFNLPNLKPLNKFKLTAHEGARARRISLAQFTSKSNETLIENHMICLSNLGDIHVLSVPELKRQLQTQCTKREDINGISSLVFTRRGEGFYLHSSSEFRRFSLSARHIVAPICTVELPEGARPLKKVDERPPIAAASVENSTVEDKQVDKQLDNKLDDKQKEVNEEHKEEHKEDQKEEQKEEEKEVIESKHDSVDQETPTNTSGIEESPVNHNEFEPPEINYNTLPSDSTEDVVHDLTQESVVTNGTNGDTNNVDNDSDSQIEVDIDISNVTESSVKTNSLDITIDSIRDHLTISTEKNDTKKRTPSPINNDSHPIINSHED